jgi:hypothetical protein
MSSSYEIQWLHVEDLFWEFNISSVKELNRFYSSFILYKIRQFIPKMSQINYILIINLMHRLLFIYKLLFLNMFRDINAHLQEDTLYTCSIWYCHSARVHVSQSVHILSDNSLKLCTDRPSGTLIESDSAICCMCTMYSPEDEHLWLETCRGIISYK